MEGLDKDIPGNCKESFLEGLGCAEKTEFSEVASTSIYDALTLELVFYVSSLAFLHLF